WNDMNGGVTDPGGTPQVKAIQEFNGKLFAGGSFMYAGSIHTRENAIWDGASWDTLAVPNIGGSCGDIRGFFVDDSVLYATGAIAGCCGCPGDIAGMFDGEIWYNMYLNDGDAGYAITVFDGDVIAGTDFKFGWNNDTVNYIAKFLGYPTEASSTINNSSQIIYPNPTSTIIHIHLPSNQSTTLSVFNLLGEKVKEEKVNGREATIDVSKLPAGFYVVRAEEKMIGKFLKEE
ncbi:MAG: T9SS type A sorting domain-containing protein, partial [Chitinophagales bacterium]